MNKNTLVIYFTALTALYSTQAIGFEWKYDLEVKVALPTSVTIGVATFPIPIDPAAERPGKITGKIKWECATSAIIVSQDGCYCTPENPAQDGLPRVVQTVNAEPYVLGKL